MNSVLKCVKLLEESGVSRQQAETHVQIIAEFPEGSLETKNLATKQDLNNLAERLEHKILQSGYRFTIKMGTIVTVVVGLATAIVKLF